MKITVQVIIEPDHPDTPVVETIAALERSDLQPETLGLTLAEAKELLVGVQAALVKQQVAEYLARQQVCPDCGKKRSCKENDDITYRTLFGTLKLDSPRLYTCPCQAQTKRSFTPLASLLPERTSPERLYLQTKWAALMSYGLDVRLLEEVLPLEASHSTIHRQVQQVAQRLEDELGEEQWAFIDGCPAQWHQLPEPEGHITVGMDGGYLAGRDDDRRRAGSFEVIAGKSITADGQAKCFAFVHTYDPKPKRRLFEVLKSQGLQMNQDITFLSDGGDTLRDLQFYLSPLAEHILDWFHVTMRITVMQQVAKGIPATDATYRLDPEVELERIKWYLWHGNVFCALQVLGDLQADLEILEEEVPAAKKLCRMVEEFEGYVEANQSFIPNYGDRYRYGERIATGFVESTVNQVISKRFVKSQQMRWTQRGAHLLLQVRTQVLNEDWRDTFSRWYPSLLAAETQMPLAA